MFGATDLFAMGANFDVQSSTTRRRRESAISKAADGDVACETSDINLGYDYEATYDHCGGGSGIKTNLGTKLTTFGNVFDSKLITQIVVTLDNKNHATVQVTGHQHDDNAHTGTERQFDVSALFPDQTGIGISMPLFLTNDAISIAATTTVQTATFTAEFDHQDIEGATGDHFSGENMTCKVTLVLEGKGTESDLTIGSNWVIDEQEDSDDNTDPDSFSVTLHQYVDAT